MRSKSKTRICPTFTYIDLFAGAGGFSLGFQRAGFKCVGAIEKSIRASETYSLNFPEHVASRLCRLGPELGDILSLRRNSVRTELQKCGIEELDVVVGGPPCQGFSRIGRGKLDFLASKKGAFKSDPRNDLYFKFLNVIEWIQPKAFLFENVPGILNLGGMNVAEKICDSSAVLGYRVLCTVLNSAWYGVPQTRERVFILGIRSDLNLQPTFPDPIYRADLIKGGHLASCDLSPTSFRNPDYFCQVSNPEFGPAAISVEEAIGDLPPFLFHLNNRDYQPNRSLIKSARYRVGRPNSYASLMRNWDGRYISKELTDHYCRNTPRDHETFAEMRPGDRYPEAVKIAISRYKAAKKRYLPSSGSRAPRKKDFVPPYPVGSFDEKWRKLVPSEPSWTITAHLSRDCYSHIHYDTQKRSITIREAARLQSFPDGFVFSGGMNDRFEQIGNAVPPLLSYALAKHLKKLLKK